jgi:DNA-binding GntR family transcriptional regulator
MRNGLAGIWEGTGVTTFQGLEPVYQETTPSIIAAKLRLGIMNGSIPQGAQLAEAQLAKQLQVSRGPLREAMQRLVQEGLLRSERHRGLFVITLRPDDVLDIYLARVALERAAVMQVLHRGATVPAELEDVVQQMDVAAAQGLWATLGDLDIRFHDLLVAASGSRRLQRMYRTLLVESRMCITELLPHYSREQELVAEHRQLLEAVRSGDQQRALDLIDAHMLDAVERLCGDQADEPDEHPEAAP